MTYPTTSIAWPLVQALTTLVAAHSTVTSSSPACPVYSAWPGDEIANTKQRLIWFENLKVPESTWGPSQAGRKQRNQTITFDAKIAVLLGPSKSSDDAYDAVSGFVGSIEDVIADDPSLGLTGLTLPSPPTFEMGEWQTPSGERAATATVSFSFDSRLH